MTDSRTQRLHGFCTMCIARCGTIATVENGRFTRPEPDATHPKGDRDPGRDVSRETR
ncbi:MAG TPA: hypothetical protein VFW70_05510 [Methylomirabilota bacterium]|nr:hypothetical protein [Methylomirabilota bacterium]